jgi:hypothetical protein
MLPVRLRDVSEHGEFPPVEDPARVGSYPAAAKAGGGLV